MCIPINQSSFQKSRETGAFPLKSPWQKRISEPTIYFAYIPPTPTGRKMPMPSNFGSGDTQERYKETPPGTRAAYTPTRLRDKKRLEDDDAWSADV